MNISLSITILHTTYLTYEMEISAKIESMFSLFSRFFDNSLIKMGFVCEPAHPHRVLKQSLSAG